MENVSNMAQVNNKYVHRPIYTIFIWLRLKKKFQNIEAIEIFVFISSNIVCVQEK